MVLIDPDIVREHNAGHIRKETFENALIGALAQREDQVHPAAIQYLVHLRGREALVDNKSVTNTIQVYQGVDLGSGAFPLHPYESHLVVQLSDAPESSKQRMMPLVYPPPRHQNRIVLLRHTFQWAKDGRIDPIAGSETHWYEVAV